MNYMAQALLYVFNDQYFWLSMSLTTSVGLFVGAVLYDGILPEVKKGMVALFTYMSLIVMTDFTRILPIINDGLVHNSKQPLAGTATIIYVTFFYILGMFLGVSVTNKAHGGRHDERRKIDIKCYK